MQDSLSGMTSYQFGGIVDRLTKFTSQNLKKLISHMNLDAFFANVDKVAVSFTREINGIWYNYMLLQFMPLEYFIAFLM